jgi:Zn-dependent protease with chaperone function
MHAFAYARLLRAPRLPLTLSRPPPLLRWGTARGFFGKATNATAGAAATAAPRTTKQTLTILLIRAFRVARIVMVSYGIYQIGYRNGLTDYLEQPEEQQKGLIAAVLSMSNSKDVLEENDPASKRVSAIAAHVLNTAKIIALEDLQVLLVEADKLKESNKTEIAAMTEQVAVQKVVVSRMSGNWSFFVTDSKDVNAFVTDILPKSIFVNKGLLDKINPTTDELAMILSHELSHVIHDHNKERSFAQGAIFVTQLVLFALVDPTGQASMFFDFVMAKIVDVLLATHSRSNEEEADLTGVKIMSRACYDAVEGSNVFIKLAALGESTSASWLDTHPSSALRAKYIKEATAQHNPHADCLQMKQDLKLSRRYIFGSSAKK